MHGRYGDIHLPCLHLKPAVEVSRIQREPVASAEYKVILMPGYACIRPPALNHQPMLRECVDAGLWQRQHRVRGDRFRWPQD
jgi:hypothetical protein